MKKYMRVLEFNKIIEMLEKNCQTPLGKEKAVSLTPSRKFHDVEKNLQETTEGKKALEHRDINFEGVKEIRPFLTRAKKGGQLRGKELWIIGQFCFKSEKVKNSIKCDDKINNYPILYNLSKGLADLSGLKKRLLNYLDPEGEVLDDASDKLKKIRKEIHNMQGQINEKLNHYLKSPVYRKYLQDYVVVERGGRLALPVKQEYQRQLPGMIHDRSSSGATLFVEPYPLVEINNKLNIGKQEEQKEIERILQDLSKDVAEEYDNLHYSWLVYGHLDFILAKASLSIRLRATQPKLEGKNYIKIVKGRHPLLKEKAVAVDIYLGEAFNTLVITGPNTGGKTVTLKMVGLMAMMAQAGLHIPAEKETVMGVFDNILADIGDEQNIEQSLSTFSGHMTNIIDVLNKATPKSLVLLDELGAGTDPSEGSGLAMAILEELHLKGALTIATSHFNELKVFAYQMPNMENASVEFDDYTLKPTYKILIGVPGSSKALLIAERLGLSKHIIKRSKEFQRKDILDVEKAVSDLVLEQKKYSQSLEKVRWLNLEAEKSREQLKKEKNDLSEKKAKYTKKAKEDAAAIVRQAKKDVKEIINRIKDLEKHEEKQKAIQDMNKEKARLEELEESFHNSQPKNYLSLSKKEIKPGQTVFVKSLEKKGQIISVSKDTEDVQVQVGLLKVATDFNDLAKNNDSKESNSFNNESKKHGMSSFLMEKSSGISPEIDLRGSTVDEAIEELNKYFDDAELAGLSNVRIIHGKGTGSLRQGIHNFLRDFKGIDSYRLGNNEEGGSGVTVVFFGNNE